MSFKEIVYYILSPSLQERLITVKVVFLLVSFLFSVMIVFFALRTKYLRFRFIEDWIEFFTFQAYPSVKIEKKWKKIKERLEKRQEAEYKIAVIEADELLDELLRKMGFTEGSLEERLEKKFFPTFPFLEELKEARKVKEDLLHDPDLHLPRERAHRVLEAYEHFFKEMGLL